MVTGSARTWIGVVTTALLIGACSKPNPYHGENDSDGSGSTTSTSTSTTSTSTSTATSTTTDGATSTSTTGTDTETSAGAFEMVFTIDATELGTFSETTLQDVPVLVRLVPNRFDFDASTPDGSELRFFDEAQGVLIPHEIEQWDPTGVSLIWVRVPEIDLTGTTIFRVEFGDTNPDAPLDPALVWSNGYIGVWHFADGEGAVDAYADASGNGHVITVGESPAELVNEDTHLGWAVSFSNTTPAPTATDTPDLDTALTISAWVKPSDVSLPDPANRHRCVLTRADAYRLCVVNLVTGNPFYGLSNVNNMLVDIFGNAAASDPLVVNEWAHLVGTYVDDEVQLYIDGQLEGTMTFPAGPRLNNRVLTLGDRYAGLIDELRLQAAPRSADWITIQHLSTTDALLQYGSPTPID